MPNLSNKNLTMEIKKKMKIKFLSSVNFCNENFIEINLSFTSRFDGLNEEKRGKNISSTATQFYSTFFPLFLQFPSTSSWYHNIFFSIYFFSLSSFSLFFPVISNQIIIYQIFSSTIVIATTTSKIVKHNNKQYQLINTTRIKRVRQYIITSQNWFFLLFW